jgi:hypothetical protein
MPYHSVDMALLRANSHNLRTNDARVRSPQFHGDAPATQVSTALSDHNNDEVQLYGVNRDAPATQRAGARQQYAGVSVAPAAGAGERPLLISERLA